MNKLKSVLGLLYEIETKINLDCNVAIETCKHGLVIAVYARNNAAYKHKFSEREINDIMSTEEGSNLIDYFIDKANRLLAALTETKQGEQDGF